MTTYEPGTVAVATVRGVPNQRVFRWTDVYERPRWDSALLVNGTCTHADEQVTDVRPLVVLDPEDREQVERLTDLALRAHDPRIPADVGASEMMVDATQAALREFANPTPPKPPEPTGLGAVVEDAEGRRWVRWTTDSGPAPWRTTEPNTACWQWDYLDAVRVLSEGVSDV